jgi:hypothetical protein
VVYWLSFSNWKLKFFFSLLPCCFKFFKKGFDEGCLFFEDRASFYDRVLSVVIVVHISQIPESAMLLLIDWRLKVRNWDGTGHVHTRFRENQSSVSKLKWDGDTAW